MKVEIRYETVDGKLRARGLVLISESKEESLMIDEVCGQKVINDTGLISSGLYECRLADGYAEHYLYIHRTCEEHQWENEHENENTNNGD